MNYPNNLTASIHSHIPLYTLHPCFLISLPPPSQSQTFSSSLVSATCDLCRQINNNGNLLLSFFPESYMDYFFNYFCFFEWLGVLFFQVLQNDIDLLNPPVEIEKRKHKLKRLVQSPNSFFMVLIIINISSLL